MTVLPTMRSVRAVFSAGFCDRRWSPSHIPSCRLRPWPFLAHLDAVQAAARVLGDQRDPTTEAVAQISLYSHPGQVKSQAC
jgi:hypothetical protein